MALGRRALGRREPPDHELFPGFSDVTELGYGSIATVFRAYERSTEREVALKLLNIRDIGPRAVESFEREARALGALSSHPNIVTLFRTFRTADGRPVLVLELCRGSVYDRVRQGQAIPAPEVVRVGIKIGGALETAHRAGILHRDVKPQNILLTEFGEPALADFGVAMLQSATQTTAGLFDFTTLHAAPELLEGTPTSPATDVYELASTLYHLIAGRSAFRAYEGESPAAVILRILRDPVQPVAGVPVELSDVLLAAMSKDARARPTTAAEFSAALIAIEARYGWGHTTFPVPAGEAIPAAPAPGAIVDSVPGPAPARPAPSEATVPEPVRHPSEPLPVDGPPLQLLGAFTDREIIDINDDTFEYDQHLADDVPADTVPRWAIRRDAVRPTSSE